MSTQINMSGLKFANASWLVYVFYISYFLIDVKISTFYIAVDTQIKYAYFLVTSYVYC